MFEPGELYYTSNHEWMRHLEKGLFQIGITDYAQGELEDITYIELPNLDDEVSSGDVIAIIESIKTTFELQTPFSGMVVDVNEDIIDKPSDINHHPFEDGWLVVLKAESMSELHDLMDEDDYHEYLASLAE